MESVYTPSQRRTHFSSSTGWHRSRLNTRQNEAANVSRKLIVKKKKKKTVLQSQVAYSNRHRRGVDDKIHNIPQLTAERRKPTVVLINSLGHIMCHPAIKTPMRTIVLPACTHRRRSRCTWRGFPFPSWVRLCFLANSNTVYRRGGGFCCCVSSILTTFEEKLKTDFSKTKIVSILIILYKVYPEIN